MNLLKAIIFIGCAVQLVHCGGQGSSEREIKVARVENGVSKAEDGRIILSSQSDRVEGLIIPEGAAEGVAISKGKLESYIANQFDEISKVTHALFSDDLYPIELFWLGGLDRFTVSFNIRTTKGDILEGIQCKATSYEVELILSNCENGQVKLYKSINMNMSDIVLGEDENKKYIR